MIIYRLKIEGNDGGSDQQFEGYPARQFDQAVRNARYGADINRVEIIREVRRADKHGNPLGSLAALQSRRIVESWERP